MKPKILVADLESGVPASAHWYCDSKNIPSPAQFLIPNVDCIRLVIMQDVVLLHKSGALLSARCKA